MLHILTLHLGDKWIDIQKRELARFISEPYKVYARLGDGEYPKENWKYKYNNQKQLNQYIQKMVYLDL